MFTFIYLINSYIEERKRTTPQQNCETSKYLIA